MRRAARLALLVMLAAAPARAEDAAVDAIDQILPLADAVLQSHAVFSDRAASLFPDLAQLNYPGADTFNDVATGDWVEGRARSVGWLVGPEDSLFCVRLGAENTALLRDHLTDIDEHDNPSIGFAARMMWNASRTSRDLFAVTLGAENGIPDVAIATLLCDYTVLLDDQTRPETAPTIARFGLDFEKGDLDRFGAGDWVVRARGGREHDETWMTFASVTFVAASKRDAVTLPAHLSVQLIVHARAPQ